MAFCSTLLVSLTAHKHNCSTHQLLSQPKLLADHFLAHLSSALAQTQGLQSRLLLSEICPLNCNCNCDYPTDQSNFAGHASNGESWFCRKHGGIGRYHTAGSSPAGCTDTCPHTESTAVQRKPTEATGSDCWLPLHCLRCLLYKR